VKQFMNLLFQFLRAKQSMKKEGGTDRIPDTSLYKYQQCTLVTSQNTEDLIYTAVEA
jgi:hypothetical protein